MACSYKTHRIGVSPFEAGDLRRHQGVFVGERRRMVLGPLAQLFAVDDQELSPTGLLVGGSFFIVRRHRQRCVVIIIEQMNTCSRGPKQRPYLVGRHQSRGVIAG